MNLFDVYPLYNVTPTKANGMYIYDDKNEKFLDLYGGHAVISIGHGNPYYIKKLTEQMKKISFYSNAIKNPLQKELAKKLTQYSKCEDYNLFMCSSGAEAIENALKLASFYNKKSRVIAFKNSFHGRTSAAVAVTDNPKIISPLNAQQKVSFIKFNNIDELEFELKKGDVSSIIFESIQGVGGLDQPEEKFIKAMYLLSKKYNVCVIADEVQSGFGRSGDFFAFQKFDIKPDIITIAKGMGNGFPVGGILVNHKIKAEYGMLGTTYGGNHLACVATLAVLNELKENKLQENALKIGEYFKSKLEKIKKIIKIKGRGLMLGIEFDFNVSELRKNLIYRQKIFTGGSSNKNLIRILPPLIINKNQVDIFLKSLIIELKNEKLYNS
ncbi:MAG: aspartate aminotransferase family protein [Flavobacteriaceae bacterium]